MRRFATRRFAAPILASMALAGPLAAQEGAVEERLAEAEARLAETEERLAETEARLERLEGGTPAEGEAGAAAEPPPEEEGWWAHAVRTASEHIELHGEVVGSFTWNLNDPPGRRGRSALRVSDLDHDTFHVTWAKLGLSRALSGEDELDWGFALDVVAGRMVEGTLSLDPDFLGGEEINLGNAYVELQVPTPHNPVSIRVGRAYGWFGVESLDLHASQMFTLSWLANFTPYTNTGLFVETELVDGISYMQYVGNGSEVVDDNNDAKTLGGRLSVDPTDSLSIAFHWIWGAEQANNSADKRLQLEIDVVWRPTDQTGVYVMLHYGQEEDGAVDRGRTAKFGGASVALRQGVWRAAEGEYDHVVLVTRWTIYRDQGGNNSGLTQTLNEVSVGVEVNPLEHLWLRFEYRLDTSSRGSAFLGKRGLPTRGHQGTLAAAVGVHF